MVGGVDFAGEVAKCEQLITRAPDLPEQLVGQFAVGGSGEDSIEVAHQLAPSTFDRGGGELCNVAGKTEGTIQPEFDQSLTRV